MTLARHADTPMFQLASAYLCYRRHAESHGAPRTVGAWPPPETPRTKRLRIGYVSSDVYAHALGSLIVGVFALHDRTRFEVFAYYTGPDARGSIRSRTEAAVDCWRDIAKLSDKQASALIVGDAVDILIDLNGHTAGGRPGVFASRPAPVIVNWLGYPGSMGTPHHQYIIADANIIPPHLEKYYSEAVRRLPCYQPNDREREVAGQTLSRAEVGLPEAAFVYCCFNVAGKITEPMFQNWMTILSRVPHAVLWLLSSDDATISRLRRAAIQACVAPERLVFAAELPVHVHLTRYRLADLFLDTFPYGAHTTGSDALWMGLPVLTLTGRSFASRVCGSLVRSAGLADMACETIEDYVQTAIRLGMDDAAMRLCRQLLLAARAGCTLFDTPALVAALEALFDGMWNDHASGRTPVPDLANLDLYAEIGLEEQHETVSDLSLDHYEASYRNALTYRDAISPIPHDRRLWPRPSQPVPCRPRDTCASPRRLY
jgi:predicted O-linked N-acetylglucosamine transferase (SPINDLY family)